MNEKLKILVVDDDRRMVRTICDILHVKGYETLPAYSGEEAVEKIRNDAPDCVLMDLKMPGMGGVEVLKVIKDLSPATPVVLMSAYPSDQQTEEAKRHGAATVLTKPIDIEQMLSFLSLLRKEDGVLIGDDDHAFLSGSGEGVRPDGAAVNSLRTRTAAVKITL